jgi:hypothetical protein
LRRPKILMTWQICKNREEYYEHNISLHIEVGHGRVEFYFRSGALHFYKSLVKLLSEAHPCLYQFWRHNVQLHNIRMTQVSKTK